MNIVQFQNTKSNVGNFGDELNAWLWQRVFKEGLIKKNNLHFLGIGSILDNGFLDHFQVLNKSKVVFGSGLRRPQSISYLNIDSSWDIRFLRGPLSNYALGNNYQYIADAAYAIRLLDEFESLKNEKKKYPVSLMPYFYSDRLLDWRQICDILGVHYISPLSEKGVEFTLREIASSEKIITEAMHGAIVADLFRVPWHRFIFASHIYEGELVSEFKWMDWQASIDLCNSKVSKIFYFEHSSMKELAKRILNFFPYKHYLTKTDIRVCLIDKLSKIEDYYLSNNHTISHIDERLSLEIQLLYKDLLT